MHKHQVIVVGAGPAGLQCALVLKNWGVDVLMIGRNHPRGLWRDIPSFEEPPRPAEAIARANITKAVSQVLPVRFGNVTRIALDETGALELEVDGSIVHAERVVIATGLDTSGAPTLDLSDIDELERDDFGFLVIDDNYRTTHRNLFVVGDAAAGRIRSLSCALGTGDGAGRHISSLIVSAEAASSSVVDEGLAA